MTEIEFRDPPAPALSGNIAWRERLAPLLDHPDRWAVVYAGSRQQARAAAANLRRGVTKPPPGRWEFAARDTEVFAKYLGPEAPSGLTVAS